MNFIGIDQSLSGTGVTVLSHNGEVVKTTVIKPGKLRGVKRLAYICDSIHDFVSDISGAVSSVREDYSYGSKGAAVFNLGELGGCVDLSLYYMMKEFGWASHAHYVIPISTHKKFCILNGAATKGTLKAHKLAYLKLVSEHTGQFFDDDNIADSYMLARTLWAFHQVSINQDFFDTLCRKKMDALVPTSYAKSIKLTPGKLRKMDWGTFNRIMWDGIKEVYFMFRNASEVSSDV